MARLARRASTTTALGRSGAGCEKLGRDFTGGVNGARGTGLVLDDGSEDHDTEGTAAAAPSKIWDSHQADMSQLRRNTFTALLSLVDVLAATCATPGTAKCAARVMKNLDRLDAAQCYITG